jgi:hypothetical protein
LERNKSDFYTLGLSSNVQRPSEEQLRRDIALCSEQNLLIVTLKKWRDNAIAHTNRRIVLGRAAFLEQDLLTYDAIQELITQGFRILNDYSIMFQGREFGSYPPEQLEDYKRVLDGLRHNLGDV